MRQRQAQAVALQRELASLKDRVLELGKAKASVEAYPGGASLMGALFEALRSLPYTVRVASLTFTREGGKLELVAEGGESLSPKELERAFVVGGFVASLLSFERKEGEVKAVLNLSLTPSKTQEGTR